MVLQAELADAIAETVAAEVAADLLGVLGAKRRRGCLSWLDFLRLALEDVGVAVLLHAHR